MSPACVGQAAVGRSAPVAAAVQAFRVDSSWPKLLPHGWQLGPVCGVAVDKHGNVWIAHRPVALTASASESAKTMAAAPQVIAFDPDGTVIAAWGGPGTGYDWPHEVHGVFVDAHDNVWVGGAGKDDNQILKFTNRGKFLLQIGKPGQNRGSNDTVNLGGPANMVMDEAANELYVADGYINHRLIVFDATTGAYKRHWGAYGKRPDDTYYVALGRKPGQHTTNNSTAAVPPGAPPPQLDLVHSVRISNDGLVYVCDRTLNRIQVFRKDGSFVREAFLANDVLASGSTSDVGFSVDPKQRLAFVLNSTTDSVYVLDRQSLRPLTSFGSRGIGPGQFRTMHNLAVDAKGDLFITETQGMRVQKFVPTQ